MRRRPSLRLSLSLSLLLSFSAASARAQDFDLVIRHARLIDGTGAPATSGDLAIRGGRIVAVGQLPPNATGRSEIDAAGRVVAPGFIDVHNHSGFTLLRDGNAQSFIRQGVTTMIFGEGGSAAPSGGKQTRVRGEDGFATLRDYFAALLKGGISTNIGTYVGSSQIS